MGYRYVLAAIGLIWLGAGSTAYAACDPGSASDPRLGVQAQQIGAVMPLSYVGTFQWDGSINRQPVAMSFSGCVVDGTVRLIGRGRYLLSGTEIDVVADVAGPDITLIERNPQGGHGAFIVAGHHEGEIAVDLSRICAIWVTDGNGQTGRLRLGRTEQDADACFKPLHLS